MQCKVCSKCKIEQSIENFEKRPDSKDGRRAYCRECKSTQTKKAFNKRLLTDELLLWRVRVYSLNNPTGRRKGKAGIIIKNSESIKVAQVKQLYDNDPYCKYCRIPLNLKTLVFDHKTPLSRNGEHTIDNIAICCVDCNNLKATKTYDEFLLFLKNYLNRFYGIC